MTLWKKRQNIDKYNKKHKHKGLQNTAGPNKTYITKYCKVNQKDPKKKKQIICTTS